MSIDKKSLALGFAIGGKWNCEINAEYRPRVWNDEAIYDYFYIDYKRAVGSFSYGRFRNASVVVGTTGEIIPDNAERISARIYKIYADIRNEKQVRIFCTEGRGLVFADGDNVPGFGVDFWVDGEEPHQTGYIYDAGTLETMQAAAAQSVLFSFASYTDYLMPTEQINMTVPELQTEAACTVQYW